MKSPGVVNYSSEPHSVELREVPRPVAGPEDIILAVEAVGVCGSDLHQWTASHSWKVNYPVVLGHEFGGRIAELGSAVRGWSEGERVVSETAAVIDPNSPLTREGLYNLEPSRKGFGYGVKVMGDNLGFPDMVAGAKLIEDLGCDFVIHHIGYDERRGIAAAGRRMPSPLDDLRAVVAAVSVPVQAVGGLTLEQAVRTPEYGAPLVVIGAPLAVDADAFRTADGNLEGTLRIICERVHGYGDVRVG